MEYVYYTNCFTNDKALCFLLLPKRIMYDSWYKKKNPDICIDAKYKSLISETVSIVNILQLSYIILLDNRRKQGFVINETVSIVNILQLFSLMTKPCFLLLSKRIMYDSWSMFTILNVSLMTKPCFLLFSKRIMYDSWSMFTILNVSLMTKPCFLSIVNIHQLSYIILLGNRRKQGFVISETVSIVNIHQLSFSLMTKPCFLLLPRRIMYDSWCMFTIHSVSLMTKPCFPLLPKRIMYDK
jgi:hypothetical protein